MLISKDYRTRSGTQPVKEYIDRLDSAARAKLYQHIRRLRMLGAALDYSHNSQVEGELRELRAWFGARHFRIYYRRSGQFAVLLHIIEKRAARLPPADTAIATARFDDFRARMDRDPRKPPRAIGSNTP